MSVFHYPKAKHVRQYRPRVYKNYGTYKRFLQAEFGRVCVYCRQPDSAAPNLNFGVDHYKPKGLPQFAPLVCEYSNLYYCCGSCNSFKNNCWPADEATGNYVPNPCDHVMAEHLRYDNGKIRTESRHGVWTEQLLHLNDPDTVHYRQATVRHMESLARDRTVLEKVMKAARAEHRKKILDDAGLAEVLSTCNDLLALNDLDRQSLDGSKPLQPLPKSPRRPAA